MEISRKNLRIISICILFFTAISFLTALFSCLSMDIDISDLPMDYELYGTVEEIKQLFDIAIIVVFVLTVIILLPQIYIGIKGIKIAKNPTSSASHITWAVILLIFSVIGLVMNVFEYFVTTNMLATIAQTVESIANIIIFVYFIKFAKEVKKNV